MVWVEGALKLIPFHHLPLAERSSTRPRCSKSCPARPGTPPGMGHPQLLGTGKSVLPTVVVTSLFFLESWLVFQTSLQPLHSNSIFTIQTILCFPKLAKFFPILYVGILPSDINISQSWVNKSSQDAQTNLYLLLEDSWGLIFKNFTASVCQYQVNFKASGSNSNPLLIKAKEIIKKKKISSK